MQLLVACSEEGEAKVLLAACASRGQRRDLSCVCSQKKDPEGSRDLQERVKYSREEKKHISWFVGDFQQY